MNTHRSLVVGAALALVLLASAGPVVAKPRPPHPPGITYNDVVLEGVSDPDHVKVTGVNRAGVIAGYSGIPFQAGPPQETGFVKPPRTDTVTPVAVDGAVGTEALAINDAGTVAGVYYTRDSSVSEFDIQHAFIRAPNGAITTFDDPALDTTGITVWGTVATGISSRGVVVGYSYTVGPDEFTYPEGNTELITRYRAFIRSAAGDFTYVSAPDAATGGAPQVGTRLLGISPNGRTVVGACVYLAYLDDGSQPRSAGFSSTATGGAFTRVVDPSPWLPSGSCAWHEPSGVNDAGLIVGNSGNGCSGAPGDQEAWLRDASGTFTTLTYPYPDTLGSPRLTMALGINNNRVIAGSWGQAGMFGESHGFTARVR